MTTFIIAAPTGLGVLQQIVTHSFSYLPVSPSPRLQSKCTGERYSFVSLPVFILYISALQLGCVHCSQPRMPSDQPRWNDRLPTSCKTPAFSRAARERRPNTTFHAAPAGTPSVLSSCLHTPDMQCSHRRYHIVKQHSGMAKAQCCSMFEKG